MPDHQQPSLVALSIRFYRLLLTLYPRAHRREYGALMLQSFRDLARDGWRARGWRGLLGVWLRTLADLLQSAPAEHFAAFRQGGVPMIESRPVTPLPWWQGALATLPGLAVLLSTAPGVRALGRLARWLPGGLPLGVRSFPIAILAVAGLLIGLSCIRRRRFPVWGLSALGGAFGLGVGRPFFLFLGVPGAVAVVAYLAWQRRHRGTLRRAWAILAGLFALSFLPELAGPTLAPFNVVSWWALMGVGTTLLAIVLSARLARWYGLAAGLVPLTTGFVVWRETFDLTYGLAHTLWSETMLAALALFLLIVAPVWVLRARSTHGQAWALVMPAAVALTAVAALNTIVRTDPGILAWALRYTPLLDRGPSPVISYGALGRAALLPRLLRDAMSVLQLLLALLLAVVLYGQLGAEEGSRAA